MDCVCVRKRPSRVQEAWKCYNSMSSFAVKKGRLRSLKALRQRLQWLPSDRCKPITWLIESHELKLPKKEKKYSERGNGKTGCSDTNTWKIFRGRAIATIISQGLSISHLQSSDFLRAEKSSVSWSRAIVAWTLETWIWSRLTFFRFNGVV